MEIHINEQALNTITAYGKGYLKINKIKYYHPILINTEGIIENWFIQSIDEITSDLLSKMCGLVDSHSYELSILDNPSPLNNQKNTGVQYPEILLIGTGFRHKLFSDLTAAPLLKAGIGVEIMTTYSAAHTYNILIAEGRRVVAGFFPT